MRAIENWREGVRGGKKLGVYLRVKEAWGWEDYLNRCGKGVVLMCRFRSGSAGRYGGGGEGVWEEDGTERKRSAICKACNSNCIETIEHVLVDCSCYDTLRKEFERRVGEVLGSGSVCGSSPLNLMLGGKLPGVDEDGRLGVLAVNMVSCDAVEHASNKNSRSARWTAWSQRR